MRSTTVRERSPARLRSAALAMAIAACGLAVDVGAQARAGDDAAPAPSPLAATFVRLEEALAPRLIGADDAPGRWISGRLSSLDAPAQTRDYAAAAARAPRDLLYAASLADACMRSAGVPPECGERDALGYWASRDPDNAVPWLLQAERARRRNNVPALIENLERAGRATRFDDYSGRGGAVFLSGLARVARPDERAAAVLVAQQHGNAALGAPLAAFEAVCAPATRAVDARIAQGCLRLATLMAERAASFVHRRAGSQIALAVATSESARALANDGARTVVAGQERCREAFGLLERAAAGAPADRERAATIGERYLAERARDGEPAACDALARALAVR